LVRQRLEHARAFAARHALVSRRRAPRPTLRERLGVALIALGERIVGAPPARRSYAARGASHG
jgi:hypothetical protein